MSALFYEIMENQTYPSSCCVTPHRYRWLGLLTPEEQKYLYDNSVTVTYKKHEIIFKKGGMASMIMFMEEGLAKVYIENETNALVLKIIPDGNFMGLTALTEDHKTHHHSAMTYVDSKIRQFDISRFRQLIKENPLFSKEIIDVLNGNSIQIYNRFFCLTFKQAYGRVADILLCLTDRVFRTKEFHLPFSRKDLAELTGLSSETVIRLLKRFSEEQIIKTDGKNFIILDHDRLMQISNKG